MCKEGEGTVIPLGKNGKGMDTDIRKPGVPLQDLIVSLVKKDGNTQTDIITAYTGFGDPDKKAVDRVFAALTGYSLGDIINVWASGYMEEGSAVRHKEYGEGTVWKISGGTVYVKFQKGIRLFPYPDAFIKEYLTAVCPRKDGRRRPETLF